MNSSLCLLLNLTSTWAMVGLIWLIQVVHYPLFALVGEENFVRYSEDHQRWITLIVLPLMFCELITSFAMWTQRPPQISSTLVTVGIVLVILIWASTFFIQVPLHTRLTAGYDADTIRSLVNGNWIRTVAWTVRGLLTAYMAWQVLNAGTVNG